MPELPEVETICNSLKLEILESKIINAKLYRNKIRNIVPSYLCDYLQNQTIKAIQRRSKYIIISLQNNYSLIIHLGMSGRLIIAHRNYQLRKHDHFIIYLNNDKNIIFNDPRRFGILDILPSKNLINTSYFKQLGVEPLTKDFNIDYILNNFSSRKTNIKNALMNAKLLVGVGNIYACESLFASGISPQRACNEITNKQYAFLIENIKLVLKKAIKSGGSTLKDYVQTSGENGYFQHKFMVYGKAGEDCKKCQTKISKIVQSGRSSFFCATCQK